MNAARALAQTLSGNPTRVVFPVMPVVIKTPAFPIVIAPAGPNVEGEWRELEKGIWNFFDQRGDVRGFLLTGAQTTQRAEQVKRIAAN
jgi:rubredoxin-NAD+ reductase